VFVLIPFLALLAWDLRRKRKDRAQWWIVALVYLGSHQAMDMLTGGIVPFYPVSDYTLCYYAGINVVTRTNTLYPDYGACSHEGIPQVVEVYPWLGEADTAMLAFLLPAALGVAAWQLWRLRKESALTEN